jgi:hypothetical protein
VYDLHARGCNFGVGELVWVYSPVRKRGRCPKLDSHWVGPCPILDKLGEVVYRVQLPPRGRKEILHRDRLAPYRGTATPERVAVLPSQNSETQRGSEGVIGPADMASSGQQVTPLPDIPQGDHSQGSEEAAPEVKNHMLLPGGRGEPQSDLETLSSGSRTSVRGG